VDLGVHDIADTQGGKRSPPWFAGSRIDGCRAGGTVAATQVVGANDSELSGVERLARPDETVPPAFVHLLGPAAFEAWHVAVDPSGMLAARHGVEKEDYIGAGGVDFAIHFVSENKPFQLDAALKAQGVLFVAKLKKAGLHFTNGGKGSCHGRLNVEHQGRFRSQPVGQQTIQCFVIEDTADRFADLLHGEPNEA